MHSIAGSHSGSHSVARAPTKTRMRIQSIAKVDYVEGKPPPNLCKDCRWIRIEKDGWQFFERPPTNHELTFSRCGKYSRLDLVSGEKTYEYTEIARKYTCCGNGFEPRPEGEPVGTL